MIMRAGDSMCHAIGYAGFSSNLWQGIAMVEEKRYRYLPFGHRIAFAYTPLSIPRLFLQGLGPGDIVYQALLLDTVEPFDGRTGLGMAQGIWVDKADVAARFDGTNLVLCGEAAEWTPMKPRKRRQRM